ncbi:MAG: cupin domain-containing protein [Candidatus Helarchaeota archaeon]
MNDIFLQINIDDKEEIEVIKGIFRKTLVYDNNLMLVQFRLLKGANLPLHSHPHEQMGYIISGKLEFYVNDKTTILKTGDSYLVKGNIEHGAKVLENSIVIDIFSPARDDYK